MSTHHFTLIVHGPDSQDEFVIDSLYEAGCDDALIASADGVQFIDFDRDAGSLEDAVLSAGADVERVDGAKVGRLVSVGALWRTGRCRSWAPAIRSGPVVPPLPTP